jgi:hypothetical protein
LKTPQRVTLEEFSKMRMDWIATNCRLVFDPFAPGDQNGFQVCRKCGGNVGIVGAYVALHDLRFGLACAGSGKVLRMAIPYCPRCEERPAEQGCIHEPAAAHLLAKSDLDNHRDLFGSFRRGKSA